MPTETLHFENARLAQQLFNNDSHNLQSLEENLGVDFCCVALYQTDPAGIAVLRSYLDQFWERSLAAFAATTRDLERNNDAPDPGS